VDNKIFIIRSTILQLQSKLLITRILNNYEIDMFRHQRHSSCCLLTVVQITNCGSTHIHINIETSTLQTYPIKEFQPVVLKKNFIKRVRVEINSMFKLHLVLRQCRIRTAVHSAMCQSAQSVSMTVAVEYSDVASQGSQDDE